MKIQPLHRLSNVATALGALLVLASCSDNHALHTAVTAAGGSSAPAHMFTILVTNDDGVAAPGIDSLVEALRLQPDVNVIVVAPAQNQSSSSDRTTAGPLTSSEATTASGYPAVAVDGLPADSVEYALSTVLVAPPDVIISGINAGQNLGPAIPLSGTIGAAKTGARHGIPALAISSGFPAPYDFATAAEDAVKWLADHRNDLSNPHAAPTTIDVLNVPTCTGSAVRGVVAVMPDTAADLNQAITPADCSSTMPAPNTDVAAFIEGFATLATIPIS